MKGFDVLHVKSAVKARNRIPLQNTHLTTGDFGQILVLKAFETIPGGDYPMEASYFCRTAPLVKPTYGKFAFKTVNAFVPYHQIAFDADAWIDGKTSFEGVTPLHRFITVTQLDQFIRNFCIESTPGTADNSQYTVISAGGASLYCRFSKLGRYYIKVFNQLGYALPQGVDYQAGSDWLTKVSNKRLSAYPLLAFFKLYNDYMSQSQRFNTSALSNALQCIKYNKTLSGYDPSTGAISNSLLNSLFESVRLNYENDYFTSAWQSPTNPINFGESITSLNVPGGNGRVVSDFTDTVLQNNLGSALQSIGQRGLDFLNAYDAWVRRNNFSGSRTVQQLYSRFGIKTDEYRSHYAEVFSTEAFPIQVGDVTATADSTGVPLGDYAGKAIMNGSKGFTCKAADYGLVLVLGYFTVTPMNAYGFDRQVLRSEPMDYYTPEFDGIGAEAISVGEFFANPIGQGSTLDTDVFGFTERYNSYRYWRDQITGDFRDFRNNGDMNTWHTGRNMEEIRREGGLIAQAPSVNTMSRVDSEYNRIFSVTSGDVDHFYLTCNFKCDSNLPILNLNQTARLGEGDTVVPRNGNTIA